jgi:hypothetical protein
MQSGVDGAIAAFKKGITKFPFNPLPVMELSNLYGIKGDYQAAITTYLGGLEGQQLLLWGALLSQTDDPFISKEEIKDLQNS